MANMNGHNTIAVFIEVDVGRGCDDGVAWDRSGKRLFDKALPNDEARRRVPTGLTAHADILLVCD